MGACTICLDALKSPVSLPCGHIFCLECVAGVIRASRPGTTLQSCPVCRNPYSIASVDSTLVPDYLRPYLLPSIRRVFFEASPASSTPQDAPMTSTANDLSRLKAQNDWLQQHCAAWRRRAELHAAATLGLANLARSARDHALKMKGERDELEKRCNLLKRKLEDYEKPSLFVEPPAPFRPADLRIQLPGQFPGTLHHSMNSFDESSKPAKRRRSDALVDILTDAPPISRRKSDSPPVEHLFTTSESI